jgi:hypothetical protein
MRNEHGGWRQRSTPRARCSLAAGAAHATTGIEQQATYRSVSPQRQVRLLQEQRLRLSS